jgi:AbrB family looped-hinge helix DNA binding protein
MLARGDPRFYGAVTVSDRGQVVIPAEARRELGIAVGDKMLVMSGPRGGLMLIKANLVTQMLGQWSGFMRQLEQLGVEELDEET